MTAHSKKRIRGNLPDVIVLCGGLGTRLRSVISDNPKALASIGDAPFLDILLEQIFDQGFERVILAVGYMGEKIIEQYSRDFRILFSSEESPLGTGGAVMRAMGLVRSEHVVVMNGDSYCEVDFDALLNEHNKRAPLASFVLAEVENISDFGSIRVEPDGRILSFEEKVPEKRSGLINAGVYVFSKRVRDYAPARNSFSLENDLFPILIKEYCYGHVVLGTVLDIGTPERYNFAKEKLKYKAKKQTHHGRK